MKKLSLFVALLLGIFLFNSATADAAVPRVMAYGLKSEMNTPVDGFTKFTFSTNTKPTKAYLIFYHAGEEVYRVDITTQAQKQLTNATYTLRTSNLPELTNMKWAIEVQGDAIGSLECTNDVSGTTTKYKFNRPQGAAIDNNPESDFFGRIYITMPKGGYDHATGIVVFDPIHNVLSNSGIAASGVSLDDETYGMHRIAVNPANNHVYYTKSIASNTAIYELTPNATNILSDGGTAKDVISGLGFTRADAVCFADDGTMFVMDNAKYSGGALGKIYKVKDNAKTLFNDDAIWSNNPNSLASDGEGGIWVTQFRGAAGVFPILAHINASGTADFKVTSNINSWFPESNATKGGSMAYDARHKVVAIGGSGMVMLFQVKEVDGKPTLDSKIGQISLRNNAADEVNGLAFDYAGNLVALSRSSERFYHYAVPTNNNSCITPAKSTMQVNGPATCRVMPHDLTVVDDGDSYTISYKTNTNAQSGNLVLFKEDGKTIDKTFALTTPIQRNKVNQITVAKSELPARNKIAWGIELTGKAVPKYTYLQEITDHTRQIYDFYNTQGVVVDNNPESDYFGMIYVQATRNGASDGSSDRADTQKAGLFIYNQWLDELNPTTNVGIKPDLPSGYSIGSNFQFNRLTIDPTTNNITYCYAISGQPAIFSMDRANLTGTPTNLLAGQTGITRSVAHCFDAEGTLYVMDLANSEGTIYKIKDGIKTVFVPATGKFANQYMSMASDGRGGLWVAQNRGQIDGYYQLVHYNNSGDIDYSVYDDKGTYNSTNGTKGTSSTGFTGGSARGALAYDAERQILAQGRNGTVVLFDVTYNATTGVPTLTQRDYVASVNGTNIDGIAFDYVGDLYVVNSSKEKFQKFTIPTDNNTCLVPAKKSLALDNAQITYELNGGVTNDYGWMSKEDLFQSCMADAGVTGLGTLAEIKPTGDPAKIVTKFTQAKCQTILDNAKWDWLEAYIMSAQNADAGATQLTAGTTSAGWAYAVAAFFIEGQRTSWPVSADFAQAGLDEAYQRAWKHGYDNPTKPTSEFVLNTPYKDGYTFDGWYAAADFSGAKVTKVQPNMNGTLYAKWIEYIPTIAEVKALANNATTNVAGVVTYVSGNEVFVQDPTGGIVLITTTNATCTVGQSIKASGTKTITNGAPQVINAVIASAEAGTLPEETAFESLSQLVNDTELKHYATRITVPGLKVASYDSNGYPTLTDGLNTALCYKMPISQSTFPVGTKVVITAVGGWNNGFQFRGDVAGVTLAPGIAKDTYAYPARENGKYTLANKWIVSNIKGNYQANKPGPDGYVRAMAAANGKMYFINRETVSLTVVDGATGEMLSSIPITGTDIFKVDGANAVTVAYNDIKVDDAGNILISACVSGGNTFFVYKVNPITGVATELIKDRLQDTWAGLSYRFDAIGVAGDVTNNGVIMAANANAWEAYRWKINGGVVGTCEKITLTGTGSNPGTAPQIQPLDAQGKQFYVDGSGVNPILFNENGTQADKFTAGSPVRNQTNDVAYLNQTLNGITEFTIDTERFVVLAATATNIAHPASYALYKFTDDTHNISTAEPLWFFPNDGMGTVTNGSFAAPVSVEVNDNVATIYLYSANNGYAAYTFTLTEQVKTVTIDEDADNTTALDEFEGETVTATVTRSFGPNKYLTLTLPFDMNATQIRNVFGNATVYAMYNVVEYNAEEVHLQFSPVSTITAGTPYILATATSGYDAEDGFTIEGVEIDLSLKPVTSGDVTMVPVLDAGGTLAQSDEYFLSNNELYCAGAYPRTILGLRAYFKSASPLPIRARVVFQDNEATSIPMVEAQSENQVRKVLKDGQLLIIRGEEMYNIQGQRME